jgi:hypothetical protein
MSSALTNDGALESGEDVMIRECTEKDFETLYAVINDSARAYEVSSLRIAGTSGSEESLIATPIFLLGPF